AQRTPEPVVQPSGGRKYTTPYPQPPENFPLTGGLTQAAPSASIGSPSSSSTSAGKTEGLLQTWFAAVAGYEQGLLNALNSFHSGLPGGGAGGPQSQAFAPLVRALEPLLFALLFAGPPA